MQILFGIVLFLLNYYDPKTLIIIAAVINAVAMFVHTGLVYLLNKTLPEATRPRLWRKIVIGVIFIFFGIFSSVTLWNEFSKFLK